MPNLPAECLNLFTYIRDHARPSHGGLAPPAVAWRRLPRRLRDRELLAWARDAGLIVGMWPDAGEAPAVAAMLAPWSGVGLTAKGKRALRDARFGAAEAPPAAEGDALSFAPGQVLYRGRDLALPAGVAVEVLGKLWGQQGQTVPHRELHGESRESEASDALRRAIKAIRAALRTCDAPWEVESVRGFGYALRCTDAPR